MNENLDLKEILKGCPKGTEFYSSVYGRLKFSYIYEDPSTDKVILLSVDCPSISAAYYCNGRIFPVQGECTLFPSKDQRDWSKFERFWDKPKVEKFDPKGFQPFDRVLVRGYTPDSHWIPTLFGFLIDPDDTFYDMGERVVCLDYGYNQCIPYNDETKHLVDTTDDCPDYYKWWEE